MSLTPTRRQQHTYGPVTVRRFFRVFYGLPRVLGLLLLYTREPTERGAKILCFFILKLYFVIIKIKGDESWFTINRGLTMSRDYPLILPSLVD